MRARERRWGSRGLRGGRWRIHGGVSVDVPVCESLVKLLGERDSYRFAWESWNMACWEA